MFSFPLEKRKVLTKTHLKKVKQAKRCQTPSSISRKRVKKPLLSLWVSSVRANIHTLRKVNSGEPYRSTGGHKRRQNVWKTAHLPFPWCMKSTANQHKAPPVCIMVTLKPHAWCYIWCQTTVTQHFITSGSRAWEGRGVGRGVLHWHLRTWRTCCNWWNPLHCKILRETMWSSVFL